MSENNKNISSGSQKVEQINRQKQTQPVTTQTIRENNEQNTSQNSNSLSRTEQEKSRANKRALQAKRRQESNERRKQHIMQVKEAHRQKRENLKRERMAHIAEVDRERAEKRRRRKEDRGSSRNGQQRLGGWITAVSILGAATLIMTTLFTVSYFKNAGMTDVVGSQYTSTMYELTGLTDSLDSNLSKLRVTNTPNIQHELLTDVVVESELASSSLEKMPIELKYTQTLSSFINRMSEQSKELLTKLNRGESLTDEEMQVVEYMYATNRQIKSELNELANDITNEDVSDVLRSRGDSKTFTSFEKLQNDTVKSLESNYAGPFSSIVNQPTVYGLKGLNESSLDNATQNCNSYFKNYGIKNIEYKGETVSESIACYNFELTDNSDRQIFAQITKQGGKLVMFDMYEECNDTNFDEAKCKAIADEFLNTLGLDSMEEVWVNTSDNVCTLSYAYADDGVVVYSDMVKVKVCQTKGIVVGYEGSQYYLNHREREIDNPEINVADAEESLSDKLSSRPVRLCLIPVDGEEALAYEFECVYEDTTYYIYVSAIDGEEIEIFEVLNTKQGRLLS